MTPAIATQALSKTYSSPFTKRRVNALNDLTLTIEPGDIYGLLGPNGAGKTTLLKVLLGIIRPTSGSATLLGKSISDHETRRPVGFLPENHRFPPFLTARQTLSIYGRLSDLSPAELRARTDGMLERVGLKGWEDDRIRSFSKGMMQRLGLAQALANNPRLLFLDEPTDGVDPVGRREIRDLLVSLRDEGMTIFLNSHLLSEVELVCSRVGILHHGRMVQTGTIAELTHGRHAYRIRFAADERSAIEQAFPEFELRRETGIFDGLSGAVDARTARELNACIDRIRSHDIQILGIVPDQQSLEARFMEIIESHGAPTDGEAGPHRETAPI